MSSRCWGREQSTTLYSLKEEREIAGPVHDSLESWIKRVYLITFKNHKKLFIFRLITKVRVLWVWVIPKLYMPVEESMHTCMCLLLSNHFLEDLVHCHWTIQIIGNFTLPWEHHIELKSYAISKREWFHFLLFCVGTFHFLFLSSYFWTQTRFEPRQCGHASLASANLPTTVTCLYSNQNWAEGCVLCLIFPVKVESIQFLSNAFSLSSKSLCYIWSLSAANKGTGNVLYCHSYTISPKPQSFPMRESHYSDNQLEWGWFMIWT